MASRFSGTRKNASGMGLFLTLTVLCFFLSLPATGKAAESFIELIGAGEHMINVVQAAPMGSTGRAGAMQKAIANNFAIIPFVKQINPSGIPGGAALGSAQPSPEELERFLLAKAHLIITANWLSASQVELRCFEVAGGRFMFGNRYSVGGSQNNLMDVADKFSDDFLQSVIGRGEFFRAPLVFSKTSGKRKKDLWSVRPNGRYLNRLTNLPGESISPAWSKDGGRIAFTHISSRSHGLGIYDVRTRGSRRINFPGGTVIGPTFLPNGTIAVSLSDGRYPSIFQLNGNYQKGRRLAASSSIDVSPSVDDSGSKMVFSSGRLGGPQIFMQGLGGGGARRVSLSGGYNTDPSISPDGTLVTYARRMGGGHRIFVQDLVTGQERQVSFGPGSDEEPAFAPDSYFIAFVSNRSGKKQVYLTTRNGGAARRLPTGQGDACFPAFGPVAKR